MLKDYTNFLIEQYGEAEALNYIIKQAIKNGMLNTANLEICAEQIYNEELHLGGFDEPETYEDKLRDRNGVC